ncbi:MAG: hypothetical protein V2I63_10600 [Pseudomonadales bacterium]|jgi:hypothetical protein|nr:hypothetical protein [Pseudomonadales bacterium]
MAAAGDGIRIRLDPEDEYTHPIEDAVNFNESMYFNIFDPDRHVGGWFRLANRPNEGRGEMSCCVYLPDGRIGFMFARPECHANDAFDNAGMRFEVLEPFRRVSVRYEGKLCLLENPQDMADPSRAFRTNPIVPARVEIAYEGVSPMFGGEPVKADGSRIEEKAEEAFARGHYEQHLSGAGTIRVGDEQFPIDGFGLRDHSWGPRYWQNIYWYRWLPMNFGRDFAMMLSVVTGPTGAQRCGGMVLRDGEYVLIRDVRITAEYDANDCQTRLHAWAKTDEREYEVTGEVMSLIPLRNRRTGPDGVERMTRITEGMTRYHCDGLTGYGLSEFLDQIEAGQPVGKVAGS